MDHRSVRVPGPDGVIEAELFWSGAAGPRPLVVYFMDAFGLRPATTAMAAELVEAGYAVLQPNLYWRAGAFAPFDPRTTFGDPPERARVMALMNGFTPAQVAADLDALLAALDGDPAVRPGPVGLVGYCMGGRQAFIMAAHLGPRAAAMASIHGGGLVRPDASSPHRGAPRVQARCYFGVADHDGSCTPADQQALGEALTAAGVAHEIELYTGKLHGFAVPDMGVYDAEAARQHHERVLALFAATLG